MKIGRCALAGRLAFPRIVPIVDQRSTIGGRLSAYESGNISAGRSRTLKQPLMVRM